MKDIRLTRPSQVDTDPNFPVAGKARNIVTSGDNTGTPWVKDIINDRTFGWQERVLSLAGIEANGNEESAAQSQITDALELLIKVISSGYNPAGSFRYGFTYTSDKDVGIYQGEMYKYVGTSPLPYTVVAGTVPSNPDYEKVFESNLQNLNGLEQPSDLDKVIVRTRTSAQAIAEDAPVGTRYVFDDFDRARYDIVSSSDSGGWYVEGFSEGKKAKLLISTERVKLTHFGFKVGDISSDNSNRDIILYVLQNKLFGLIPSGISYSSAIAIEGVKYSGLKGVSCGLSEIRFTGTDDPFTIGDAARTNACRRLLFSNFRVADAAGQSIQNAFNLLYCVDSTFKLIELEPNQQPFNMGFRVDWSWDNRFDRCFLGSVNGMHIDEQANNNSITGNRFGSQYSSTGTAIELNRGSSNFIGGNNDISSCNLGIVINGAAATRIESNWFENNAGGDIYFSGALPSKSTSIKSNQFESRGLTSAQDSIKQSETGFSSEDVSIDNNTWNANNDGLTKCIVMSDKSIDWQIGKQTYTTTSQVFYNGAVTVVKNGKVRWFSGEDNPEGAVSATLNELYSDVNSNIFYIKKSGVNTNTGWEVLESSVNGVQGNTTITPDSGSVSLYSSYNSLRYNKTGNKVTVTGTLKVESVASATGAFRINLPYTCSNSTDEAAATVANVILVNSVSANSKDFVGRVLEGTNYINVLVDANVPTSNSAEQLKNLTDIIVNVTYFA